jgi:phospholipid/cholesterol/gamma-HCH transport system substrate-binding protein
VFTFAIFLLGQKSALFSSTTTLYVSFADISGLNVGAPVRLAGLEVGSVAELSFPERLDVKETRVRLVVQTKYMERIRKDSRAFIDSAGLLGDKVLNISMGSPEAPRLEDGDTLETGTTVTFEAISKNLDEALQRVASITKSLDEIVQDEGTAKLPQDLSRITGSLANILSTVESGPGVAHRLIYDPKYAEQVEGILADTRTLARRASGAVASVEAVVAEVERGQGTLHDLIYGQNGKQAVEQLAGAAREIHDVVRAVREGDGVLHTLVYAQDQGNFLRDLNELSATLNRVVQDVDKGRGTVGGLLRDPTVYEDLKSVLGNVKRNVLLKALIRFTMEEQGLRRMENAPEVKSGEGESPP